MAGSKRRSREYAANVAAYEKSTGESGDGSRLIGGQSTKNVKSTSAIQQKPTRRKN